MLLRQKSRICHFRNFKFTRSGLDKKHTSYPRSSDTVAFNRSGKKRMVLDVRHVNLYLYKFKYRFEDADTARNLFKPGDYAFRFDLKSAYHHIEVFESHRKYLGFYFNKKYYVFNVLPSGF